MPNLTTAILAEGYKLEDYVYIPHWNYGVTGNLKRI